MRRIAEFFAESSGKMSGPRAIFNLFGLGVVGVWCWLSVKNGQLQPIPMDVTYLLGLLGALKVVQKPFEGKKDGSANGKPNQPENK
jgi:hypothetical protein